MLYSVIFFIIFTRITVCTLPQERTIHQDTIWGSYPLLNGDYGTPALFAASNSDFPRIQVGQEVYETYETAHPYEGSGVVWERTFQSTNATYIRIHFAEFDLASGDYVEISSPDGKYRYQYEGKGKVVRGGEAVLSAFWASHIPGDTAIVRLNSTNPQGGWGLKIDKWAYGYMRGVTRDLFEIKE